MRPVTPALLLLACNQTSSEQLVDQGTPGDVTTTISGPTVTPSTTPTDPNTATTTPTTTTCEERDDLVRFVALGDAGEANTDQQLVADAMAQICDQRCCDFALYLGDNF